MQTSFPKDRIKVVLLESVHERAHDVLGTEGFSIERVDGSLDEQSLCDAVADAHLVGIRSKTQITERVLDSAGRLLAVGCFCIGTNQVDLAAARSRGVPVFNSPFCNTRSVAELTIAEIVMLYRRVLDRSVGAHQGRWLKSASGSHEVRGRTLGIVGYGRIGSQVSVLAESMGMRVIYHDVVPTLPLGNARQSGSLEELLSDADVVTLHVPADETTRDLISGEQLARMKPGSMLINNARGSVVDVEALAGSLREGHLGGAALDVFPVEPGSADERFESSLQGLENVILTPHIGGSTVEAQRAIAGDVATKLTRFVNIGTTTGAVNVPEVELPEQPGEPAPPAAAPRERPHRLLHFHRNVPGVMSRLHSIIAEVGANVTAEHLRTRDDVGYVVLDVEPTDAESLMQGIRAIPETIRTRLLW